MNEKILGDYEIVKQFGEGPLGKVFLANHRFIKRPFVIKLLPPNLENDPTFIKRFTSEIATLSTLEHPNLVKVHNVSHCDESYFLVCECIVDPYGESTTLLDYFETHYGQISEDEIIYILTQIASALDFIHHKKVGDEQIAHRGLKWGNLLVGETATEGPTVYLSDTGLAHLIGESVLISKCFQTIAENLGVKPGKIGSSPENLTSLSRSFMDSFAFLSPEQKNSTKFCGAKADVYSFGVLAYYLIMQGYPEGLFPLPSEGRKSLRCDWDSLIKRCLQKDPIRRPDSLIEQLQLIRESTPKTAPVTVERKIPLSELSKMEITTPKPQSKFETTSSPPPTPLEQTYTPPQPPQEEQNNGLDAISMHLKPKEARAAHIVSGNDSMQRQSMGVTALVQGQLSEIQPVIKPQKIARPEFEQDPGAIFQKETTVAPYKPKESTPREIDPILTDMVVIQGGEFYRGCNEGARDERPMHLISASSFAIDLHPVTNEQFIRFLEMMAGEKDHHNHDIIRLRESRIRKQNGKYIVESGYSGHPVVGVSWYGAVAYAKWIGKRLPTEAEWEIACRGLLKDNIYPTGNDIDKDHANYFSADTTPVRMFPPNPVGLFDMVGNVYEWCSDWYDYNFYECSMQEPENPRGPAQGVYRVLRGGCWKSLKDDLRCSHRHRNHPGTTNRTYGFRCASDAH